MTRDETKRLEDVRHLKSKAFKSLSLKRASPYVYSAALPHLMRRTFIPNS